MTRLSIVIPVHNDGRILDRTLSDLLTYIRASPFGSRALIFIENGSRDDSAAVLEKLTLDGRAEEAELIGESIPQAGIGYAYHRGSEIAIEKFGVENHWVMLTASDLPFGSSDLEEFIKRFEGGANSIYIGSKAHPESVVQRGFKRRLAGRIFYLLRRVLLGMHTGDPQGVFFVRADVLAELIPHIRTRNFFYSTELTYFAEKKGYRVDELPVVYQGERRPSSVRIFTHGSQLIGNMLELRKRPI